VPVSTRPEIRPAIRRAAVAGGLNPAHFPLSLTRQVDSSTFERSALIILAFSIAIAL